MTNTNRSAADWQMATRHTPATTTDPCPRCKGKGQVRRNRKGSGSANRSWYLVYCDCPAALAWIAKHDIRVGHAYQDSDGVWIEAARGWTVNPRDAHDIHEDTIAAAIARLRDMVPCDCESCHAK